MAHEVLTHGRTDGLCGHGVGGLRVILRVIPRARSNDPMIQAVDMFLYPLSPKPIGSWMIMGKYAEEPNSFGRKIQHDGNVEHHGFNCSDFRVDFFL